MGGSLDYLINNAAYVSHLTTGKFLDEFESDPTLLDDDIKTAFITNVVRVINTTNVLLPLIKKSHIKKVVGLSSGMGDLDFVNELVPGIEGLVKKFLKAAPNFPGPMTPLESVEQVLSVVNAKSVENGDGGAIISLRGGKTWF
ncbi:uncharacterized protein Z519_00833 [Cladophialophora bantiana CBS 173.52]|uniref:Uncharacterized protein n=1 Tax=Cladophialophora bantiana (strain ATCC 10958 / CBS 173.52 / CDC B-1940 / NIH 8579) TaxID=1442370 RepID=A0A0D2I7C1_CLAB1|nr:uncharacterized protein Z519_00833 [Cladophialophora bantiana CBS 173.52]KIW99170.1 hypothetical protein Z519_00833 [Cladophialophora bantiana CBS 173.52]